MISSLQSLGNCRKYGARVDILFCDTDFSMYPLFDPLIVFCLKNQKDSSKRVFGVSFERDYIDYYICKTNIIKK